MFDLFLDYANACADFESLIHANIHSKAMKNAKYEPVKGYNSKKQEIVNKILEKVEN